MKQVTAVQWLIHQLIIENEVSLKGENYKLFELAKEMEKQQIIDSFEIGYENGACVNEGESIYHGNNYYNQTYKSE
jgi:hypothetical protein